MKDPNIRRSVRARALWARGGWTKVALAHHLNIGTSALDHMLDPEAHRIAALERYHRKNTKRPRQRAIVMCSRCAGEGHNKRTCTTPIWKRDRSR